MIPPEAELVTHYPLCFGCGESNPISMGITAYCKGNQLWAEWTPPSNAEGGPGVVHGGYLAAAVDEIQALLASSVAQVPAMTATIEVSYRSPVLTNHVVAIEAEVVEQDGRKFHITMRGTDRDSSKLCFEGKGLYIAVRTSYWRSQMRKQGIHLSEREFTAGDVSSLFSWHVQWLLDSYMPRKPVDPASVLVEFSDVKPSRWSMRIEDSGLQIDSDPELDEPPDASIAIRFSTWQAILKDRANPAVLIRSLGGRVDGEEVALDRLVSQLPSTQY